MHPFNPNYTNARGPFDEPDDQEHEDDEELPPPLTDEDWEALVPDDDYEPLPEYGDCWRESD